MNCWKDDDENQLPLKGLGLAVLIGVVLWIAIGIAIFWFSDG
jgi:hypothetical protein